MARTTQAQAGRERARGIRLKAARERRLELDPDQMARGRRIDEAVVDVEGAWEERAAAQQAVVIAELAAAAGIARLLKEKLAVADVARLTGLDSRTVRRFRSLKAEDETGPPVRRATGS